MANYKNPIFYDRDAACKKAAPMRDAIAQADVKLAAARAELVAAEEAQMADFLAGQAALEAQGMDWLEALLSHAPGDSVRVEAARARVERVERLHARVVALATPVIAEADELVAECRAINAHVRRQYAFANPDALRW